MRKQNWQSTFGKTEFTELYVSVGLGCIFHNVSLSLLDVLTFFSYLEWSSYGKQFFRVSELSEDLNPDIGYRAAREANWAGG